MSWILVLSDGLIRSCLPEGSKWPPIYCLFPGFISEPWPSLSLFSALLVGSEIFGSGVRHLRELLSPVLGPNHPPTKLRKRLRQCLGTSSPAACKPGNLIWGVLTGYQEPVPPIRELTELTLYPTAALAPYTCEHTCVHMHTHSYTCILTCIHTIHTYPITYMLTNFTCSITFTYIPTHTHTHSYSYTYAITLLHTHSLTCTQLPHRRNVLC